MNIAFEYPAYILSIDEYDKDDNPKNVVQGIEDNNERYLRIIPPVNKELSQEEKNIIENL